MPKSSQDVLADALALDVRERADLAAALIESLDPTIDDEVDAAWEAEIERRVAALDRGDAVTIPWAEVQRRLTLE